MNVTSWPSRYVLVAFVFIDVGCDHAVTRSHAVGYSCSETNKSSLTEVQISTANGGGISAGKNVASLG